VGYERQEAVWFMQYKTTRVIDPQQNKAAGCVNPYMSKDPHFIPPQLLFALFYAN
jgi:hypothetical protein